MTQQTQHFVSCLEWQQMLIYFNRHKSPYIFLFSFQLFPSGITTVSHLTPSNPVLCILFSQTTNSISSFTTSINPHFGLLLGLQFQLYHPSTDIHHSSTVHVQTFSVWPFWSGSLQYINPIFKFSILSPCLLLPLFSLTTDTPPCSLSLHNCN